MGSLAGNLEVLTNHPAQQRLLIPVSGFVRPRLSITPNEADFGSIARADRPITRTLPFRGFRSEGIRVTRIESDVPGVSVEVKEAGDAHEFQLLLTVGPEVPAGPFHGVVDIHTTDRVTPILRLPIRGEVR